MRGRNFENVPYVRTLCISGTDCIVSLGQINRPVAQGKLHDHFDLSVEPMYMDWVVVLRVSAFNLCVAALQPNWT